MISKIIILAIALGITVPVALEKGIQDTMNDPANIQEAQEYEEYANNKIHEDEVIEKFEYILDKYDGSIDVQEGEIEAYLEENGIPYERVKDKNGRVLINAEQYGIHLQVSYDHLGSFSPFSKWERVYN